jgi:hypothetical protein
MGTSFPVGLDDKAELAAQSAFVGLDVRDEP